MSAILRKHLLFAGIVTCLASLNALAQSTANNGIQLTATVVSVEPRYSNDCWETKKNCEFEIDLLLQYRNNTSASAIVCTPRAFYGNRKISFLNGISKTSTESTSTTIKWENPYANYRYDPLENLVRTLLIAERPVNGFFVLQPDAYHEWRETIVVPIGYELKKEPDPRPDSRYKGRYIYSAVPKHPALKIEYLLSVRKRPEHPNALEKAKENWKEFGNLILDSSGDYRIESEVILNKLP